MSDNITVTYTITPVVNVVGQAAQGPPGPAGPGNQLVAVGQPPALWANTDGSLGDSTQQPGNAGQVLTSQGYGLGPLWETASGGNGAELVQAPNLPVLTAAGDGSMWDSTNSPGTNGQVLTSRGPMNAPLWENAPASASIAFDNAPALTALMGGELGTGSGIPGTSGQTLVAGTTGQPPAWGYPLGVGRITDPAILETDSFGKWIDSAGNNPEPGKVLTGSPDGHNNAVWLVAGITNKFEQNITNGSIAYAFPGVAAMLLRATGAITGCTVGMPPQPVDGQNFLITCNYPLTGLAYSTQGGAAVENGPTSLPAGGSGVRFIFSADIGSNGTWVAVQLP